MGVAYCGSAHSGGNGLKVQMEHGKLVLSLENASELPGPLFPQEEFQAVSEKPMSRLKQAQAASLPFSRDHTPDTPPCCGLLAPPPSGAVPGAGLCPLGPPSMQRAVSLLRGIPNTCPSARSLAHRPTLHGLSSTPSASIRKHVMENSRNKPF